MLLCPVIIPICRLSDKVCALMMRSMFALLPTTKFTRRAGADTAAELVLGGYTIRLSVYCSINSVRIKMQGVVRKVIFRGLL